LKREEKENLGVAVGVMPRFFFLSLSLSSSLKGKR
jgi:hypothetical protein